MELLLEHDRRWMVCSSDLDEYMTGYMRAVFRAAWQSGLGLGIYMAFSGL